MNYKRFIENMEALSRFGRNQAGGIDRALGSDADLQARNWLTGYWNNVLGKEVRCDAIANLWLHREGTEQLPPIVIGSHHDTVPNGGKYDGAMGVLLATELMETLIETGTKMRHPIAIVSFTGEEPNPFQVSTLGSKVLSGRLHAGDLKKLFHRETGEELEEAIRRLGGHMDQADEILMGKRDFAAFLECHIEQGRRLLEQDLAVGAVTCITGIYRENIIIRGEANHAGTTLMENRKDALLAAGYLNLAFEKILKEKADKELVGTIGYMEVKPNSANIIPGEVELVLEIRTTRTYLKEEVIRELDHAVNETRILRQVVIDRQVNLDQAPSELNQTILTAMTAGMKIANEIPVQLASMAGHDAANMQRIGPSGMIFVRSEDGKSHCPEEYTREEDLARCGEVLYHTVLQLDQELDRSN